MLSAKTEGSCNETLITMDITKPNLIMILLFIVDLLIFRILRFVIIHIFVYFVVANTITCSYATALDTDSTQTMNIQNYLYRFSDTCRKICDNKNYCVHVYFAIKDFNRTKSKILTIFIFLEKPLGER